MISRSTLLALAFACFATLSLAMATNVADATPSIQPAPQAMQVYQLPRVVINGRIGGNQPAPTQAATNP